MRYPKIILLVTLIALMGCKKRESTQVTPNVQPATDVATPSVAASDVNQAQPAIEPPPPNVASKAENAVQTQVDGVADDFLTSQLRIFIRDKGRLPQSFTEFARTRLDSVPRPAAGLKWVIDASSKEVKAVKRP